MSSRPMTHEDANLLEDLIGGDSSSADPSASAFGAQWNELFGKKDDDFGEFVGPSQSQLVGGGEKAATDSPSKGFLPSQLFDRNLSLYAKQSSAANTGTVSSPLLENYKP